MPIKVYFDEKGRAVLISGHRRIESLSKLTGNNTPGLTTDRERKVVELEIATPENRLVQSISDHAILGHLPRAERIRVARRLLGSGDQPQPRR